MQPEITTQEFTTVSMQDLIVENRQSMLAYARQLTRNPTSAEDVFQSACVNALNAKRPDIYNAKAWLNSCVRSAFLDRCKKERRYVGNGDAIVALRGMDGAQTYTVELAEISRALDAMSPGRREAFRLVAFEGMDGNEAGAVMGISRHAVSVQYRRAKALLLAA